MARKKKEEEKKTSRGIKHDEFGRVIRDQPMTVDEKRELHRKVLQGTLRACTLIVRGATRERCSAAAEKVAVESPPPGCTRETPR